MTHPKPPLRVAVEATALLTPLTGIGRYTLELIHQLDQNPNVELSCYYGWRWHNSMPPLTMPPNVGKGIKQFRDSLPGGRALQHWLENRVFSVGELVYRPQVVFAPNFLSPASRLSSVITVHDLSYLRYPETHPEARVKNMERRLPSSVAKAGLILADSQFVAEEIEERLGVPSEKLRVLYPGVSEAFFAIPEEEQQARVRALVGEESKGFVLFLATLEPRKNLARLLQAYQTLPKALRMEYPLVLAGKVGWGMADFADEVARLQEQGMLKMLGYVPEELLPALYRAATCLAYPSIYEGFGLPPVEAMAAGCPVLAGRAASMPEVCSDAAMYADPLSVEEIASQLERLLIDTELRARLTHAGPERARAFTWQEAGERLVEHLQNVVRRPS